MSKISIVTVTYNCVNDVERTVKSVINQDYADKEYIIIDGNSQDGTKELLDQYKSNFNYFISEPDKGIYDAMNKAIRVAKGEWLVFMNAGDSFASSTVLSEISSTGFLAIADVIYANVIQAFEDRKKFLRTYDKIAAERVPYEVCHQATLTKTNWLKKIEFDTSYKICADCDTFVKIKKAGGIFVFAPITMAYFEVSCGATARNIKLMYKERRRIDGNPPLGGKDIINYCKWLFRFLVMRFLPQSVYEKMMFKYMSNLYPEV